MQRTRPDIYRIDYDDTGRVESAIAEHGEYWHDIIDPFAVRVCEDAGNDLHCAKARCTQIAKQHKAVELLRYDIETEVIDGVQWFWRESYDIISGWWE